MAKKPYEVKIDKDSLYKAEEQLWSLLYKNLDYLNQDKKDFIRLAFDFMVERHGEQRRQNGDFYIVHTVNTAITLAEIEFDKETISAALLHDVPEDTYDSAAEGIESIKREFGAEVAFLVSGITKLSVIKYVGQNQQTENLRKLFVAMSKDLRVIFIKLADRLHNLRTLKYLRPDKAQRIALESIEVYAAIAERLGIGFLRSQIEEAAFPFAYEVEYKNFCSHRELELTHRSKIAGKLIKKTKTILDEYGTNYISIAGRAKNYYSIYKKMVMQHKAKEEIFDLVALRIVTNNIANCYEILSILHGRFDPIEDRIKDYIQNPKENGYQSLHTTVIDRHLKTIFEFQIRTQKMHQYAEYGVAAHWWYKENLDGKKPEQFLSQQNFAWLNNLLQISGKNLDDTDYLKYIRLNIYPERIFVLTPKGDVMDLPTDATPLDFAYKIHEFIGSHAVMAKVNGKVTKLNEVLKSGDVVEIVTSKSQKPRLEWLNWVKAGSSAKKIRAFLREIGENFVGKE